jgi:hypothetical protein
MPERSRRSPARSATIAAIACRMTGGGSASLAAGNFRAPRDPAAPDRGSLYEVFPALGPGLQGATAAAAATTRSRRCRLSAHTKPTRCRQA